LTLTQETQPEANLQWTRRETEEPERAFLVGVCDGATTALVAEEHLDELASLSDTMGVPVAGRLVARVLHPSPRLYLGQGKAEEIKALAQGAGAGVIIFDFDLSPSQQRNWEKFSELAAIDRQEVILDIFAGRARTQEARLQVGLARMQYSLPRLRRAWTHLERQRGGAGHKGGPGELQLEVDRRIAMDRIARFKRELKEVRKRRAVQRKSRSSRPVPSAAIVGYTNVGKSSLLRRLTGADVFVEDKLFATLDTTTRRIDLSNNQPLLLTDTVGFIRKLPHGLVEAFKATLEEAVEADFLIHVLDVSSPKAEEQYAVTNQVLDELGARDKPTILALNKCDCPHDTTLPGRFRMINALTYAISTHTGEGVDALLEAFARNFVVPMRHYFLRVPQNRYDIVHLLHSEGTVIHETFEPDVVEIEADCPIRFHDRLAAFIAE
jgi:GTP-binding protein HflX